MKTLSPNLYEVSTEEDFCYKTLWENHGTSDKFSVRWNGHQQTYYFDRPFHFIVEGDEVYEKTSVCLDATYKVQSVSSGYF